MMFVLATRDAGTFKKEIRYGRPKVENKN